MKTSLTYLTINQLKPLGYNRFQLQNLRKNGKVRFQWSPMEYCLQDVQQAKKEDFKVDETVKTVCFWAKDIFQEGEIKELEVYMNLFWTEYRKVVLRMFLWGFMTINEYSAKWPFNCYDNRSLYRYAQGFVKSSLSKQESQKEMKEKKIIELIEKTKKRPTINNKDWRELKEKDAILLERNLQAWKYNMKKLNDLKLSLKQKREIPKFKFFEKDFYCAIGDENTVNARIRIKWGFFVTSILSRRIKVPTGKIIPETVQTWKIHYNKNKKLVCSVTFKERKPTAKTIGTVGIDIWPKTISLAKLDKNGCLRWRKTFSMGNIQNYRNKKVHIEKLVIEILTWCWNYRGIVMEDLKFKQWVKGRILPWWPYSKILTIFKQMSENRGFSFKTINPAFTSFIGLVKYQSLWLSITHNRNSKDESAAITIWRRWQWFGERIPTLLRTPLASLSEKPSIGSNWKLWSLLKKGLGEQTALLFVKVFLSTRGEGNREEFKMKCLKQLRDYGVAGFRKEIDTEILWTGVEPRRSNIDSCFF